MPQPQGIIDHTMTMYTASMIVKTECSSGCTLSRWWIIIGTSPASITACTWIWLPAVMLDRNHTASFTHTHTVSSSLFSGCFSSWTWVSQYQNGSVLDFIRAKDDGDGGDNWSHKKCRASDKLSPPTNHYPAFYRPDVFPITQLTVSEHTVIKS